MESRDGHQTGARDAWATGAENSAMGNAFGGESAPRATAQSRPSAPPLAAPPVDASSVVRQGQAEIGPGKIACSWCGAMNPEGALRCGSCGYRFAVRCHTCGMTNPKDAANCAYCGESLRLAPFDTMEIARARAALRVRRLQAAAKGQSSGIYRRGPAPGGPKPLSRLFLLLLVTGGATLALAILLAVLVLVASGASF